MLLMLLALLLLTTVLAFRPDPPPPDRLVVLDTSASMGTIAAGQTRYAAALTSLEAALGSTGDGPITLVTTAPARVLTRGEASAETVLRLASELEPAGEDEPIHPLLSALCSASAPILIALVEDQPLADLDCPVLRPTLPDPAGNRGITGLALRSAGAVGLIEAHLEVTTAEPVEVRITADGIEPTTLTLTPTDGTAQRILRLSLPTGGALTASLLGSDPFPADDQVSFTLPPPAAVTTRLVTTHPEGFLARALAAHPEVELEVVAPGVAGGPVDLLVLEAEAPTEGARRVLALSEGLSAIPVVVAEPLKAPLLLPVDETNPLTRYLDPTGLRVDEALRLSVPEGGSALLRTDSGAVGVLLPGGAVAALGLSLSSSDLALRLDFAHLMANVVEWAKPDTGPLPVPIGVLSAAQSTARVTTAEADEQPHHRRLDHRPALVLAGILLLAEWGIQAWGRR